MIKSKRCCKCHIVQTFDKFARQKNNKDRTGYNSYCKECYKLLRRKYYLNNREAALNRATNQQKRKRYELQLLKSKLECKICGQSDPRILDFHHIDPKDKSNSVRHFWYLHGKVAAAKEMEKCEMLCANCHRKHHLELTITKEDVSNLYPSIGEYI